MTDETVALNAERGKNGFGMGYWAPYVEQYTLFSGKSLYAQRYKAKSEEIQMSDGKKYFVLMENGKDTSQVFASKQPRGAALKAATRGHTTIRLRERGTKRVHVFSGSISMVPKPAGGPDWLPDMIKKANVKKQGIEHL